MLENYKVHPTNCMNSTWNPSSFAKQNSSQKGLDAQIEEKFKKAATNKRYVFPRREYQAEEYNSVCQIVDLNDQNDGRKGGMQETVAKSNCLVKQKTKITLRAPTKRIRTQYFNDKSSESLQKNQLILNKSISSVRMKQANRAQGFSGTISKTNVLKQISSARNVDYKQSESRPKLLRIQSRLSRLTPHPLNIKQENNNLQKREKQNEDRQVINEIVNMKTTSSCRRLLMGSRGFNKTASLNLKNYYGSIEKGKIQPK